MSTPRFTAPGASPVGSGGGPPGPAAVGGPAPSPPQPEGHRAFRVPEGAILGGVCTGLARHLGWPLPVLRVGFVVLGLLQFVGVLAYAALWLLLPPAATAEAPGIEAATRRGMRTPTRSRSVADAGTLLALAALGAGLVWLVQLTGLGISSQLFWPVAFACVGAALVWRQADTAAQKRWRTEAGGRVWLAPFVARGGWPAIVRVVFGLGLVGSAFGLVVAQRNLVQDLPGVLALTVFALAGVGIVLAPWLYRSRNALHTARADKVRADARADMAAHLHDSVLQTLALIQRQADDPKAVQQLARRQERELRTWLYGDSAGEATLKAALTATAAEVEDEWAVPVEVVAVGDCPTTEPVQALVAAAREAMVNAAKHSGSDTVDVYAEVDEDSAEVYVRDRGRGFDLDAIAEDRLGVKRSIVDRMARHGGTATVKSGPGAGTEVRLEIRR